MAEGTEPKPYSNNIFVRSTGTQSLNLSGKTTEQYSITVTKTGYKPLLWTVFSSFAGENISFSQNETTGSDYITVSGVVRPNTTTNTVTMAVTVLFVKNM